MDGEVSTGLASRLFAEINLGDERRYKRLLTTAEAMCRRPGGTWPDKLNDPAILHGFYRMVECPKVTHEAIMKSHAEATRRRLAELEQVDILRIHDATELDYSTIKALQEQLGQIGQGTHRGYICHNSLAVRADTGDTVGLLAQILHHRADVSADETVKQKRERQNRESRLWVKGVAACGPTPNGVRCIDVADSLSDTFEFLSYETSRDQPFLLRARENRKLMQPVEGKHYLFDALAELKSVGAEEVGVLGSPKRKARRATLQIAFCQVDIAPPGKRLGDYESRPLKLWAVRAWEENTSAKEEKLEWKLLTNVAVENLADAKERLAWYRRRPIIEEFHKGMKTGCGIETMQFENIERLEPAIALISAVATSLLNLRDAARADDGDERPATDVIDAEYVEAIMDQYPKRLKTSPTVRRFYMHVARLGGHQNRKGDGFPGWITLWRGWTNLQLLVAGRRAARRRLARQQQKCVET